MRNPSNLSSELVNGSILSRSLGLDSPSNSETVPDFARASYTAVTEFPDGVRRRDLDEDTGAKEQGSLDPTFQNKMVLKAFQKTISEPSFLNRFSTQSNGTTYSFRTIGSSNERPDSFVTARSSIASYVTASSGRRTMWSRAASGAARQVVPLNRHHLDISADYSDELDPLSSTTRAIFDRILSSMCSFRPDGSIFHNAVTDADRLRFQTDGVLIRKELAVLRQSLLHSQAHNPGLLERAIDAILEEAFCFLRKENGSLWRDASNIRHLKHDVALLVYDFASTISPEQNLDLKLAIRSDRTFTSEWLAHLSARGLILDDSQALDWSGRGQHVEYLPNEEHLIPLREEKILGHSATAVVQSVKCRRIMLARKTIRCNRRLTKEVAITEVEHLQRLQHRHIVRLVGTYTYKRNLAILIYPVAQWNLEEYLDELVEVEAPPTSASDTKWDPLFTFIGCLSNAIDFMHSQNVKHMDIKPGNLLIRNGAQGHRIYIADFGIARAYKSAGESFTDSPTSFTRIYAAPEVAEQDIRGLPADIFSLGCVFMEILSTIATTPESNERAELTRLRSMQGDNSYHMNLDAVLKWHARTFAMDCDWNHFKINPVGLSVFIRPMLSLTPDDRPSANFLAVCNNRLCCMSCFDGTEPFEAAEGQKS